MDILNKTPLIQFIKFLMVGVMNTCLTLVVIYICKSFLGINEYVSNLIGYVAGLINSFLWNKNWVFRSRSHLWRQAAVFFIGFGICYLLQLGVVYFINDFTPYGDMEWQIANFTFSGYAVATLAGMVVYTIANFIFNRVVTFREE